jgi:cytochrome c-type biogenesis protein CcmH/NrfF
LILWLTGPVLLGLGALVAFLTLRRRQPQTDDALSALEEARLQEILQDGSLKQDGGLKQTPAP